MDLKLTVARAAGVADVLVSVEPSVTVGALAERLQRVDPAPDPAPIGAMTLAIASAAGWSSLPPSAEITRSGLTAGCAITVVPVGQGSSIAGDDPVLAVLEVVAGPDAGREIPLTAGEWSIGRGHGVPIALSDRQVSKRHAVLRIGRDIRITDHNSANGTQLGGVDVASALLGPQSRVTVGDTVFRVRSLRPVLSEQVAAVRPPQVAFNRSPRVEAEFTGLHEEIAEPPQRPLGQAFPFLSILIPIGLGLVIWQVTGSGLTALFLALSSLLLVGAVLEQSVAGRRGHKRARSAYRATLAEQRARFARALQAEGEARRFEQPSVAEVTAAVVERTSLLWARRADGDRFGQLRLGTATRPSRSRLAPPPQRGDPALLAEANAAAQEFLVVSDVPVATDLDQAGAVGVCGPIARRGDVARGLVLQLVALHSPQELAVSALVPPSATGCWAWLRWLPHCAPARVLGRPSLAADSESCQRVLAAAEQLVLDRTRAAGFRADVASRDPLHLLVVEDGAPVERGRLVALAEQGGRVGVHVLWSAAGPGALPAACRSYLELHDDGTARVGNAGTGEIIEAVRTEGVDVALAESVARLLAPVVDAGEAADRLADLPRSASFVEYVGRELVQRPTAIADRWQEHGSRDSGSRDLGSLRALVGHGAGAPVHLDLREHGPHALVGGTTGAGKSEFLQSWILGMAVDHSPQRVTFLLVDYKGGAAFSEVVRLPHTVGLVTDLTPRLVRRALMSLRAEVRHRERILAAAGVPDLRELERRGDPGAPPALVIVVDEFAALVQEVPEFVDGVIDVAQRGRSLGLHLILATQRPAGVIKDNLRANTNLRVALRMADEDDSIDVLGSRDAALFDPAVPGRAMAKTGPGQVTAFQALYAGGRTSATAAPPAIAVHSFGFGPAKAWENPDLPDGDAPAGNGPTDVHRIVEVVQECARGTRIAPPRRPWLPELPALVELAGLAPAGLAQNAGAATVVGDDLVFGLVDDPDRQQQGSVAYSPDDDGSLLVLGTGASGKSTTLRGLAIAAGLRGGYHVYGLDFGSRGLTSLEHLPHVGSIVVGDDSERVSRLLDWLRTVVDERAERYARVSAASIQEYRVRSGDGDEPRILLLLDNFGGFRSAYEMSRSGSRLYDLLPGLALDGRSVGVHLAVSADRPGVIPPGLAAAAKKRLALRLVEETDLATAGLGGDAFGPDSPPGRGYLDGFEVQVAVLGNEPEAAQQVEQMRAMGARMRDAGLPAAPPIGRLTDAVELSSLPSQTDGLVTLGVADDTLRPIGFEPTGTFLIAGPPQSGRTTALLTVVESLQRCQPARRLVYFGTRRSPLVASTGPSWSRIVLDVDEVADVAREWIALAAAHGDARPRSEGNRAGESHRAGEGPALAAVIENVPSFADTVAQEPLEQLISAFVAAGHLVIGEGESSALTASWGLPRALKSGRHGLLLQPDQEDGESVLRTTLPRLLRSEFPPGRAMFVRSGRIRKLQVALPA